MSRNACLADRVHCSRVHPPRQISHGLWHAAEPQTARSETVKNDVNIDQSLDDFRSAEKSRRRIDRRRQVMLINHRPTFLEFTSNRLARSPMLRNVRMKKAQPAPDPEGLRSAQAGGGHNRHHLVSLGIRAQSVKQRHLRRVGPLQCAYPGELTVCQFGSGAATAEQTSNKLM